MKELLALIAAYKGCLRALSLGFCKIDEREFWLKIFDLANRRLYDHPKPAEKIERS